jgi:hypothetical protein
MTENVTNFAHQSMVTQDVCRELNETDRKIAALEASKPQCLFQTNETIIADYSEMKSKLAMSANKQKKMLMKTLSALEKEHPQLILDYNIFKEKNDLEQEIKNVRTYRANTERFIDTIVEKTNALLTEKNFIDPELTTKGRIASQFQEIHPLAFAELMEETDCFNSFTSTQLAGLFAMCIQTNVPDEDRIYVPSTSCELVNSASQRLKQIMNEYYDLEQRHGTYSGSNYDIGFDLQPSVVEWCYADNEASCHTILNQSPVFLGEFVKCLLKINHMAMEVERAAEVTHRLDLVAKMRDIPHKTLKFIATNRSLYI